MGRVLSDLEYSIEFEGKNEFIRKCREMNKIRNTVFHQLSKETALEDLRIKLSKVSELYEEIFDLFQSSHDWFCLCFKNFRKDVFLDYVDDGEYT